MMNNRSSATQLGRKLFLPATLLTLIGTSAFVDFPGVNAANAAPAPEIIAAPIPAVAVPAPAPAAAVPASMPASLPRKAALRDTRGLSPKVLSMALDAVSCARERGVSGRDDLLTVIDYSLPSTQPRLWVLDLEKGEVLYHELVAHGAGTGDNYATRFSNVKDSRQTSLGLFLTAGTYQGGNGYSLVLKGLDRGLNDRAEERHIVMHGAWYVSPEHARQKGRLGRSWGCPALSQEMAPRVIDTIKGGSFVFSYSGSDTSFQRAASSRNSCGGGTQQQAVTAGVALAATVGH
ncbi:MAG TPA: murein L,D-transpeptidase catalytic domain family protein [Thermoanaerobaculia bacterium]|nr:murein L,D-transpeptidase catalytic domain family protein [Thermoanaerobaculia bacterium]